MVSYEKFRNFFVKLFFEKGISGSNATTFVYNSLKDMKMFSEDFLVLYNDLSNILNNVRKIDLENFDEESLGFNEELMRKLKRFFKNRRLEASKRPRRIDNILQTLYFLFLGYMRPVSLDTILRENSNFKEIASIYSGIITGSYTSFNEELYEKEFKGKMINSLSIRIKYGNRKFLILNHLPPGYGDFLEEAFSILYTYTVYYKERTLRDIDNSFREILESDIWRGFLRSLMFLELEKILKKIADNYKEKIDRRKWGSLFGELSRMVDVDNRLIDLSSLIMKGILNEDDIEGVLNDLYDSQEIPEGIIRTFYNLIKLSYLPGDILQDSVLAKVANSSEYLENTRKYLSRISFLGLKYLRNFTRFVIEPIIIYNLIFKILYKIPKNDLYNIYREMLSIIFEEGKYSSNTLLEYPRLQNFLKYLFMEILGKKKRFLRVIKKEEGFWDIIYRNYIRILWEFNNDGYIKNTIRMYSENVIKLFQEILNIHGVLSYPLGGNYRVYGMLDLGRKSLEFILSLSREFEEEGKPLVIPQVSVLYKDNKESLLSQEILGVDNIEEILRKNFKVVAVSLKDYSKFHITFPNITRRGSSLEVRFDQYPIDHDFSLKDFLEYLKEKFEKEIMRNPYSLAKRLSTERKTKIIRWRNSILALFLNMFLLDDSEKNFSTIIEDTYIHREVMNKLAGMMKSLFGVMW